MEYDEFMTPLTNLLKQGNREDAYIWFREHQDQFSKREQRLIRAYCAGRLWQAPMSLAALMLVLQIFTGGISVTQFQDFFSFLGRYFRPYMYVTSVVPMLINLLLIVRLAIQCHERLAFTFHMLGKRPPLGVLGATWAIALVLSGWLIDSLIPYAQDLPLVMEQRWPIGIVTHEQYAATALHNARVTMGYASEGEYVPPWYSSHLLSDGSYSDRIIDIHIDGITCLMSDLQFRLTDLDGTFPIRIEYLPHSKLVLWISCGEEQRHEE